MKYLLFAVLIGCSFLLAGCPLQTGSPIKGEEVSVPEWMLRRWLEIKADTPTGKVYLVEADASDKAKMRIIPIDAAGKPDMESVRPAFISRVNGQPFLSIYEAGDEATDEGYYHYALGRNTGNGDIQLVPLKEYLVDAETSGEKLAAFIAAQTKSDDYLDKGAIERFRKQK